MILKAFPPNSSPLPSVIPQAGRINSHVPTPAKPRAGVCSDPAQFGLVVSGQLTDLVSRVQVDLQFNNGLVVNDETARVSPYIRQVGRGTFPTSVSE